MDTSRTLPWVLVAAALLPGVALAGPPPAAVEADFVYAGSSATTGTVRGGCAAVGIAFPAGPFELNLVSTGGIFFLQRTWVNYTILLPNSNEPTVIFHPDRIETQRTTVPAGPLRIQWGANGTGVAYPRGYGREGDENLAPFRAQFEGDRFASEAIAWAPRAPVDYWRNASGIPIIGRGEFPGFARASSLDNGTWEIRGNLSLYLRAATWTARDDARSMDPWEHDEFSASTPAVITRIRRFTDAFLDLADVHLVLPAAGPRVVCAGLDAEVVGGFVGAAAAGEARRGPEQRTFEGQVVSLLGTFHLQEQVPADPDAPRWVRASARGDIRVVGIDFAAAFAAPDSSLPEALTILAVLVLLMLGIWKGLGHLVGTLYARLQGPERVLEHAGRRRLLEIVRDQPGLDVTQLARATGYFPTTVSYHLAVLRRNRLVRAMRYKGSLRVLPIDARFPVTAPHLPSEVILGDPRMRFLHDALQSGSLPWADLLARVATRFDLTPRGARALVTRGIERGVIRRSLEEGKLWIHAPS